MGWWDVSFDSKSLNYYGQRFKFECQRLKYSSTGGTDTVSTTVLPYL